MILSKSDLRDLLKGPRSKKHFMVQFIAFFALIQKI